MDKEADGEIEETAIPEILFADLDGLQTFKVFYSIEELIETSQDIPPRILNRLRNRIE